jgi:hypothetical protein
MASHFCHQVWTFDSCRAHYHPVDTGIEQSPGVINASDAAPHLYR